ncbi:UNVERIFIED_CONTAM: hypothetical protein Sindi_2292300 [Sesamum indicum]
MTQILGSGSTGVVLRLEESQQSRGAVKACSKDGEFQEDDPSPVNTCKGVSYAFGDAFTLFDPVVTVIGRIQNEVPMSNNLAKRNLMYQHPISCLRLRPGDGR